jgi:hypothetical protein
MVRVDKVLTSPHREGLEYLCNILPDFRMLIGPSGARMEDFVAVVIATNDPRSIASTFVAARYKESPRIRAIADQPLLPGDPRVFRFLKPGLGALVRPEDASKLEAEDSDRKEWLAQLEKLDQKAASTPGLVATVADVPSLVRLGDGLPTPQTLALAATFEDSPAVRVRGHFASEADAEKMLRAWPDMVRRYRTATAFVGLAALLDGMEPAQHGADLEISGRLPAATIRLALQLARAFVPPPRAATPAPIYAPPADGGM